MKDIAPFPLKLQPLFQPRRYKVLYGGRGSAKSWSIARALLLLGTQRPLRVLCVRELQVSIDDSVHKLLADQISLLGLDSVYKVMQKSIIGPNGTTFSYEGVRNNANKIRSYEGIDVCWAEEAANISENSWNVLIPTIRKEGSEIWISFNPELETDHTYVRFVKRPQPDSWVEHFTFRDNPWFSSTLRREMEALRDQDYDSYLHVWEGQTRLLLEGAVYMKELRAARQERRITRVPYDPTIAVEAFFDLGWDDSTSIWLRQKIGFELHYIGFYQNRQEGIGHYLKWLRDTDYLFSMVYLPHDGAKSELGTGMTILEQVRRQGFKCRVLRRIGLEDGINAARTIFPMCWFDQERCAPGLEALGRYRYEIVDEGRTLKRSPVHDSSSHAADSFRYSALASKSNKVESESVLEARQTMREKTSRRLFAGNAQSWMGM